MNMSRIIILKSVKRKGKLINKMLIYRVNNN